MKTVKDYMKKDLTLIQESTLISEIIEVFSNSTQNILPVVDSEQKLEGIINIDELLNTLLFSKEELSLLENLTFFADLFSDIVENLGCISPLIVAKDIMQPSVVTIKENDSMVKAAIHMKKKNVHRLIVINENNKPVGYISRNEVCKAFLC
jgi:predicted transcriptional regulator